MCSCQDKNRPAIPPNVDFNTVGEERKKGKVDSKFKKRETHYQALHNVLLIKNNYHVYEKKLQGIIRRCSFFQAKTIFCMYLLICIQQDRLYVEKEHK